MSEMNRVQRWRQQQRAAGKDALTIWLSRELKLFVEDIALKRHCSPSGLVEQALTTCYPLGADVTGTVTDTPVTDMSQIRLMLQQELRAFFGDSPTYQGMPHVNHVTDTVTDTATQTEAERVALRAVQAVTDTITDTQTAPAPDVTGTVVDTEIVTDTVTVTRQDLEPFDTTKFYLGKLCSLGHDFNGTGMTLRRKLKSRCDLCHNEDRKKGRAAKRTHAA